MGDANDAAHVLEAFAEFTTREDFVVTTLLRQTQDEDPLAGVNVSHTFENGVVSDLALAADSDVSIAISVRYQF